MKKLIDDNEEIQEILNRVKMAKLNQDRFHQINEKQTRQLQEIVKDAEVDEKLISGIEEERRREREKEERKKFVRLQGKYVRIYKTL